MIERLLGDEVEDSGKYLAEVIYGTNDGIVTTFAGFVVVGWAPLDPYLPGSRRRSGSRSCSPGWRSSASVPAGAR